MTIWLAFVHLLFAQFQLPPLPWSPGSSGPTFPVHTVVAQTMNAPDTITTGPLNVVGATSIWLSVSRVFSASTVVSDSAGNTYTAFSVNTGGAGSQGIIQFCVSNPMTSSMLTVTGTNNTTNQGIALGVLAFKSTVAMTCPDVQSQAGAGTGTAQAGSITPTNNNSTIVAAVALNGLTSTMLTINQSFVISDTFFGSGVGYGLGQAYLLQPMAAAVNPTWTNTGSIAMSASIGSTH